MQQSAMPFSTCYNTQKFRVIYKSCFVSPARKVLLNVVTNFSFSDRFFLAKWCFWVAGSVFIPWDYSRKITVGSKNLLLKEWRIQSKNSWYYSSAHTYEYRHICMHGVRCLYKWGALVPPRPPPKKKIKISLGGGGTMILAPQIWEVYNNSNLVNNLSV